ncbi:hypothetical protein EXIGLDRAFT_784427 [Exidia glandulosa HHB12029]|uniref:Uncharacterized protein n=1 Tax=Exidia glandulosa HHB12029 TaxID=1314781 RepID=A0A166MGM6_EXIGL|nr:hypothetical protein EXIGLDRAFT_784427 [Exidia glandulosa HHB12029]
MESNPGVPRGTALHRFIAQLPIEQQERTLNSIRSLSVVALVAASLLAHGIADHLAHKLHEDLSGEKFAFACVLLRLNLRVEMLYPVWQRRFEVLTTMSLFIMLGAVIRLAFVKVLWTVSDFKGQFVLLMIIIHTLAGQAPPGIGDEVPPQFLFWMAAVFGVYGLLVYLAPSLLPGLFSALVLYQISWKDVVNVLLWYAVG